MREAVTKKLYSSYRVEREDVEINLLQYADDTIFWCETSLKNVLIIKVLRCFEMVVGLKVNFQKSNFGVIGVEESVGLRFAQILNCKLLLFPFGNC